MCEHDTYTVREAGISRVFREIISNKHLENANGYMACKLENEYILLDRHDSWASLNEASLIGGSSSSRLPVVALVFARWLVDSEMASRTTLLQPLRRLT